ncbi:hypothetical protein GNY16_20280 [Escherichia coli]|nr:hypothetical protein [Escherichia coli]EFI8595786.1 hypothetical protein [Escherichia coli]
MPNKSKIEPYDHLLGEMHDKDVAALAGTLPAAVCKRRMKKGIDPYPLPLLKRHEHLMGKQSDLSISELIGVTGKTVGDYRRARGIDRYTGLYRSKLAKFDPLIGTMSNAAVARLAGCSREGVRGRRTRIAAKPET